MTPAPLGTAAGRTLAFYFCNWPSCALPKPLPVEEAAPAPRPPPFRKAWDRRDERHERKGRAAAPCPPGSDRPGTAPAPRLSPFLRVASPARECGARPPGAARPVGAAPGQGSQSGEQRGAGPAGGTHPARCSQRTPRCSGAASTWLPPPTCPAPEAPGRRRRRRRRL